MFFGLAARKPQHIRKKKKKQPTGKLNRRWLLRFSFALGCSEGERKLLLSL